MSKGQGEKVLRMVAVGCTAVLAVSATAFALDTVEIEPQDETGHRWDTEYTVDWQPTCTQAGRQSIHCLDEGCDAVLDSMDIEPLGHSFTVYTTVQEPTCQQEGIQVSACDRCGETDTVSTPRQNHVFEQYVSDHNATCERDGTKTAACVYGCGTTSTVTERGTKLGHKYMSAVTKQPTCTEDGVKTYVCTRDSSHQYTKPIEKLGHNYKSSVTKQPTCTKDGVRTYTCTRDSSHRYTKPIKANGHTLKEVVTKASPKRNGKISTTCKVCKAVTKTVPIARPRRVELNRTQFRYSGKNHHTKIRVYDANGKRIKGKNYDISYPKGRKTVGKKLVKITFRKNSNYTGSLTASFRILPPK